MFDRLTDCIATSNMKCEITFTLYFVGILCRTSDLPDSVADDNSQHMELFYYDYINETIMAYSIFTR